MQRVNLSLSKTIHIWKRINKAEKLDPKEMVTQKELVYSNMMQIEAISRLLVRKGIITNDELRAEYEELKAWSMNVGSRGQNNE